MSATVERLDFGSFSKVERTPQGGLRVPANLTRTGVLPYTRADGSVVRELRPPDEVFHADSLATLKGAPVTNLHPPAQSVTTKNWRKLAVGHVAEDVREDGKFVAASLMIQDAAMVDAVERKDRQELSCGYRCRIDATPGVHNGEPYDVVQRDVRYNHIALGPKGWGRAGREVALRLDAHGNQITGEEQVMKVVRIDGVEYEIGSDAHLNKIDSMHKAEIDTATARADKAEGERDVAIKERDTLQAKLDVASDPKAINDLVEKRAALTASARETLGAEVKLDGKTNREIMVDVIRHDDKDFDAKDESDDYVQAYFDASRKRSKRSDSGVGAARAAGVGNREDGRKADSKEVDRHDAGAARQRMIDHNNAASDQPLRFSREG